LTGWNNVQYKIFTCGGGGGGGGGDGGGGGISSRVRQSETVCPSKKGPLFYLETPTTDHQPTLPDIPERPRL